MIIIPIVLVYKYLMLGILRTDTAKKQFHFFPDESKEDPWNYFQIECISKQFTLTKTFIA